MPALLALMLAAAGAKAGLVYPAPRIALSQEVLPAGASLVRVRTADGLDLTGVAQPARSGMPTLLILHGNGSGAADAATWFAPLAAAGYGLVAAEYRGYSGNPGRPGERGLAADADAFLALARARAGAGPVWVVGHSLGGGVAFGLARRHRLDALVTIGTFTRLRAMAPRVARAFLPDAYDNQGAVATLDEPLFLIHGDADDVVPLAEARALHGAARAAGCHGRAFVIAGAGHEPDADILRALFAEIGNMLAGRAAGAVPAGVRAYPFGTEGTAGR